MQNVTASRDGSALASIPVISVEPASGLATLDEYDSAIAALDAALRDAEAARRRLDRARREMDILEARHIVNGVTGRNDAERKARLLLALLDDDEYRDADERAREATEDQRVGERRVTVAKERCRLMRAALAVTVTAD